MIYIGNNTITTAKSADYLGNVGLDLKFWRARPLRKFIQDVNIMGHPDARYGLLSHYNDSGDIFQLDQLYFEQRRRTVGLEWIVGADWEEPELQEFQGETFAKVIRNSPVRQIRSMKYPTGVMNGAGEQMEDILFSWNFPFRRNEEDIRKPAPATITSVFPSFKNSHLFLLFEDVRSAKESGHIEPSLREKVAWLLDNVQIGRDAEQTFRELLSG